MQYFEPNFLDEALVLLDRSGEAARVLAGGTLLGPRLRANSGSADVLVNVKRIQELSETVEAAGSLIRVGSLCTAAQLAANPLIVKHAPLLAAAAASLGARQLRTVATLGGNLCSRHHSADLATALLALDATCTIASLRDGEVEVSVERFLQRDNPMLRGGELLLGVEFPLAPGGWSYQKMQTRRGFEMALVCVAVSAKGQNGSGARIAFGGAAATPVRATAAEAALGGAAITPALARDAARVASEVDAAPHSDARASAEYRRHLVGVLVERALIQAAAPRSQAAT